MPGEGAEAQERSRAPSDIGTASVVKAALRGSLTTTTVPLSQPPRRPPRSRHAVSQRRSRSVLPPRGAACQGGSTTDSYFGAGDTDPSGGPGGVWAGGVLGGNDEMAVIKATPRSLQRVVLMSLLGGVRPSGTLGWVSRVAPAGYPGRRRGRALDLRAPAAGPGRVGKRCWLRAGGVGPWRRSADPGRGGKEHRAAKGPVAQAWHTGAAYRRDGNIHGPQAMVERPGRLWVLDTDGLRRAVGPWPPAAADGARDRGRNPARRVLRPAGGPGRAAAQAEDRRRLSPGRSRIGSPATGGLG